MHEVDVVGIGPDPRNRPLGAANWSDRFFFIQGENEQQPKALVRQGDTECVDQGVYRV